MKLKNIYGVFLMALMLIVASCDPIEDRDILSNSFDPDDIDLQVVQATDGGNKLSIQMNTEGVTGYWDYIIDKKYTDRVEVIFPFTGTHTFTYHVTTPYLLDGNPGNTEFVEKEVSVEITQLDEPLPDAYYSLIGENLEGKTWVFDGGPEPDGRKWWYMAAPYNWEELWWNAGGDCCPPADAAGKMVFDLNGGANYTYYSSPDAAGVEASFVFNADYTTITFDGASILGYDEARVNPSSTYEIIELTSDKMILYTATKGGGTGWVWVFVPAE